MSNIYRIKIKSIYSVSFKWFLNVNKIFLNIFIENFIEKEYVSINVLKNTWSC